MFETSISHVVSSDASATTVPSIKVLGHKIYTSRQFPLSTLRSLFINDVLQVPRSEGSHNSTDMCYLFVFLEVHLENRNIEVYSVAIRFWESAMSNVEVLPVFWWIGGKFSRSWLELSPKLKSFIKTDGGVLGNIDRSSKVQHGPWISTIGLVLSNIRINIKIFLWVCVILTWCLNAANVLFTVSEREKHCTVVRFVRLQKLIKYLNCQRKLFSRYVT